MALSLGILGTLLGVFSLVISLYNTVLLKVAQGKQGFVVQGSEFLGNESARALTQERGGGVSIYDAPDEALNQSSVEDDPLGDFDFYEETEI